MRVIVFAPNGIAAELLAELGSTAQVTVVRWNSGELASDRTHGIVRPPVAQWFVDKLSGTLPGRMIVRVLPVDTGARFWRASRRSSALTEHIRHADLLVAAERDAGFAVWKWMRRSRHTSLAAVRGIPAARTWLAQRRSS